MRTEVLEVKSAVGKLLYNAVFYPSGKKLLAKGRLLSEEDIRLLDSEGHCRVSVAVLEDGEVPEEEAAIGIASQAACGAMEIRVAAGGRANLHATENCCLLLDEQLLCAVNLSGCLTMATGENFSYVEAGNRLATVKTAPFAVRRAAYEEVLRNVSERGPLIQARPMRNPTVGVLYTDPRHGDRARQLFEGIMRTRLSRIGASVTYALTAQEDPAPIAKSLEYLLRAKPTVILVASTTAPAGPEDAVGRGIGEVGCRLESFLAPVEPGNLLLLAYAGEIPVVAAPGCFRSPKPNVVDLVLPPLLARYPLSGVEISSLGHGGLLQ